MVIYLYVQNNKRNRNILNLQNSIFESHQKLKNKEDLIKTLLIQSKLIHETNGTEISPGLNLYTEDGESISLKKVIGDCPKLVFRYSEIHCQNCVDNEIKRLKEFIKELDDANILIFASYDSFRNLGSFKRINQIKSHIYNLKNLGIDIERSNIPYYFVLDYTMKVKDVFIPDKYLPESTNIYLDIIKEKYKNIFMRLDISKTVNSL